MLGDSFHIVGALFAMMGLSRGAEPPRESIQIDPPIEEDGLPWPNDLDVVPQWRLDAEARAAAHGYVLPNYRTRREFEAAVEACRQRLEPPLLAVEPVEIVLKPALSPESMARQFLYHIMDHGGGQYTNEQLTEHYFAFCRDVAQRHPAPENFMRQHLKRMRGVRVGAIETRAADGKRYRPTLWTIRARDDVKVAA